MEIEENPVSVSGFLLKMHRLLSNVDFGYILLYAFVAQLVELLTWNLIISTNAGSISSHLLILPSKIARDS